MRKTTSKKLLSLALSFLMTASALVSPVFADGESADTDTKTTLQEISETFKSISYEEYVKRHEGAVRGNSSVTVKATDYLASETTADVSVVSDYEGKSGQSLQIEDNGKVTWTVNIPKAGLYAVKLSYCSVTDKTNSIERVLYINGEVPFSEARYLLMKKTWKNNYTDGRFEKDANGNELRPTSYVQKEWKDYTFIDSNGYYANPFEFYFEEGENTLSLEDVRKKYAEPRRTGILYDYAEDAESEEDAIEDYPVTLFLSQHGYFKKITPQSLRMSGEQKFKEDDALSMSVESSNAAELMFFTDKAQVYKTRASDFADGKASQLGDYLPAKLGMDEGESVMGMVLPGDYSGYMIFFFENGKAAKVELSAYKTTSNRRRLTGAYSDKSPLKALLHLKEDREIAVYSTEPRVLIVNTALLGVKTTRTTQGVALLTLKKKYVLDTVRFPEETGITDLARYRGRSIPATGALLKTEDSDDKQLSLI